MKDNRTEEDNNLWEKVIESVKKLPENYKLGIVNKKPVIRKTSEPNINYPKNNNSELVLDDTGSLDGSTAKKFRKNEIKIEAKLDLHGFTEEEAYYSLNSFIKSSYAKKLRCILIVTGKGEVIKPQVPKWLNQPDLRPLILSAAHPDAKLGGTGALYILLKRQRD